MTIQNTGWVDPNEVNVCEKTEKETFTSWSKNRLKYVKKDEPRKKGTAYDLSAVTFMKKDQKSGYMYAYDFKFNIPSNAIIKKVEILQVVCGHDCRGCKGNYRVEDCHVKLKSGASLKSEGIGNNVATHTKLYSKQYCNYHGMMYITISNKDKSIKDFYGVDITPAMLNDPNFGLVVQYKGLNPNKSKVHVDYLSMRVEYDDEGLPPAKPNYNCILTSKQEDPFEKDKNKKYKVIKQEETKKKYDNPTPYNFYIRTTRKVTQIEEKKYILDGKTPQMIMFCETQKLKFPGGGTSTTIPEGKVDATTDEKVIKNGFDWLYSPKQVYIDPDVEALIGNNDKITSWIKLFEYEKNKNRYSDYDPKKCISTLELTIEASYENVAYSQTIIRNCKFINNKANKGSAIYNTGRISITDTTFSNNKCYGTNKNNCEVWDVYMCRGFEFK